MFEGIKEAFSAIMESAPAQEIGAELGRMMVQGRAEVANALFNGSAFVPYGDGQREAQGSGPQQAQPEPPQQDMGMEM